MWRWRFVKCARSVWMFAAGCGRMEILTRKRWSGFLRILKRPTKVAKEVWAGGTPALLYRCRRVRRIRPEPVVGNLVLAVVSFVRTDTAQNVAAVINVLIDHRPA